MKPTTGRLDPRSLREDVTDFVVRVARDAADVPVRMVGLDSIKGDKAARVLLSTKMR